MRKGAKKIVVDEEYYTYYVGTSFVEILDSLNKKMVKEIPEITGKEWEYEDYIRVHQAITPSLMENYIRSLKK